MGQTHPGPRLKAFGDSFWNIRAEFRLKKIIDIGTHMSIVRLRNGKFLVIDTVPLEDGLKEEIDELTNHGENIEAVIATHPFHTLAFPPFYHAYPKALYYGTPRHLRIQKEIPWAGNIQEHLSKWEDEVHMRIPDGSEFVQPLPEESNHFNAVLNISDPNFLLRIAGVRANDLFFHPSVKGPGLYPTPEAPDQFKAWLENVIRDWDFDNICVAHKDNLIGGAKEKMITALANLQPTLDKLKERNKGSNIKYDEEDLKKCSEYNVKGSECG
jgi:hypothetical protein